MLTQEELKLIQNAQMRIMDDIHRVCVSEGYRYYLIGGSALGAVRHKGIIPWDVDIDIAMPRKDYESFISVGGKKLNECFEIHDYRTDRDFGTVHALVVLKNSNLLFKGDLEFKDKKNRFGVFVDILPLDQFPADEKKKQRQIRDLKRINAIKYYYYGAVNNSDGKTKKLIKLLVKKILHYFISLRVLNGWQQKIAQRYDTRDEGNVWCSMLSHYSMEKLTMPKEYFGTPKLMEFSGRQYYVPEKTEDYLKQLFGDYMKLPSKEQQFKQIDSVYYASWYDENNYEVVIKNY